MSAARLTLDRSGREWRWAHVPGLFRSLVASVAGRGSPQTPQEYLDRGISLPPTGKPDPRCRPDEGIELDPSLAEAFAQRALATRARGTLEAAIADFTRPSSSTARRRTPTSTGALPTLTWPGSSLHSPTSRGPASSRRGHIDVRHAGRGEEAAGRRGRRDRGLEHARSIATDREDLDALEEMLGSVTSTTAAAYAGPGEAADRYNEGNDLTGRGEYEAAIAAYSKAIKLDPALTFGFINRGLAQQYLGRLDLALADMTRAVELEPGFALAYYTRGNVYGEMGANGSPSPTSASPSSWIRRMRGPS